MSLLSMLLLASALTLLRVTALKTAVIILFLQSLLLSGVCLYAGLSQNESHLFIAAILTLLIKGLLIPYSLRRLVLRLKTEKETHPILSPNMSFFAGGLLLMLSHGLLSGALPASSGRDILSTAITLVLLGLLLLMIRRQAPLQIVGLVTLENGLYLLGLSITGGLPLVIELGIFLDLLVAVIVLLVLTRRLKYSFQTTDTSVLKNLKG